MAAHSSCWAKAGPPPRDGRRATTTRERWHQVHDLLGKGVGLLECARRLNVSLNTVKRYARVSESERLQCAPQYRPTLVDPYRDHLRRRRSADPAVSVSHLFTEIKALGYQGSFNLLYRYITQGRVEAGRLPISPRRLTRLLLTRPGNLNDEHRRLLDGITTAPKPSASCVRCTAGPASRCSATPFSWLNAPPPLKERQSRSSYSPLPGRSSPGSREADNPFDLGCNDVVEHRR